MPEPVAETNAAFRRIWLQRYLQDLQARHHSSLQQRARKYANRVRNLKWMNRERVFQATIQGSEYEPYIALVYIPEFDPQDLQEARTASTANLLKTMPQGLPGPCVCTCPYSDGQDTCKHTMAMLSALVNRLAPKPDTMLKEIFQPRRADWQYALEDLDRELCRIDADARDSAQPRRIVWRIDFGSDGGQQLDLYALEQKLSATGIWLKPRPIREYTLIRDFSAHVTDQDRNAARQLFTSDFGDALQPLFRTAEALAGHPLVFLDHALEQPARIIATRARLHLERTPDGYELLPQPELEDQPRIDEWLPVPGAGVLGRSPDHRTLYVVPLKPQAISLFDTLRSRPVIPEQALPELFPRLQRIDALLPVRWPEELTAGSEPAPAQLVLQMSSSPDGLLAARMRARFEGATADQLPGAAPERLLTQQNGQIQLLRRDLATELRKARPVIQALELHENSGWSWQFTSIDESLEFIERLQAFENTMMTQGSSLILIEWEEGRSVRVVSSDSPVSWRVEIDDRKDWFGIAGTISFGGEDIPLATLLDGLQSGRRFIEAGPGRFVRVAAELRQRLQAVDDVVHRSKDGLELDLTAAPVLQDVFNDQVMLKACRSWSRLSERMLSTGRLRPEVPAELNATLRDYQVDGFHWLKHLAEWGTGACLADDMGLGKTVQTLAMLVDRQEKGPALVVAPKSVGFNWCRECERFAPTLNPIAFHETDRDSFLKQLKAGDVVVIGYALLQREIDKLAEVKWGTLVLDEAQAIKNSQTQTAQAVRRIDADWKLALTGTPIENHLGELWSLFRAISPGLFGSWDRFRTKFATPIERDHDPERQQALARMIRPFVLRRTKEEVLRELPERTEVTRSCELTPKEKKLYENVRLAAVMQLTGLLQKSTSKKDDPRFQVLAALTRLRQLACHPALVDASWKGSSSKLDMLMDTIEELREGGHRALVFSQFTEHLALVRAALDKEKIAYQYLDGKTPAATRRKRVDAFQDGEGELFLISLKAGGTGLNLTTANYVIHLDPWWNPAVEDQASDRAHRIGQTRAVTIIRLVARGTIEEQILELHADKRNLVAGILEGTDRAGKLSTTELVDLIRSGEAIPPARRKPKAEKVSRP